MLLPAFKELCTSLRPHTFGGIRSERGSIGSRTFCGYFMRFTTIWRQDHATERDLISINNRKACNRRAARAIKGCQKRAFASQRHMRVAMRQRLQQCIDFFIANTTFDTDCALPRRRQKDRWIKQIGNHIGKVESLQSGAGEERAIHFAFFQLAKTRLDIAAEHHHLNVGTQTLDHCLTTQR